MNNLHQTILITGATSGFGKETAKIFIKNGWKVIITGRRGNRLEDLTKELGENCLPLCFDITDRVAVKKEIENIQYTDLENIKKEVLEAKRTFQKYRWPLIDVTRKSVEETAASIIKIHEIYLNNVK